MSLDYGAQILHQFDHRKRVHFAVLQQMVFEFIFFVFGGKLAHFGVGTCCGLPVMDLEVKVVELRDQCRENGFDRKATIHGASIDVLRLEGRHKIKDLEVKLVEMLGMVGKEVGQLLENTFFVTGVVGQDAGVRRDIFDKVFC